jgi:hypothetical protein
MALPDNTVTSVARLLGVSRSTIYKYVPEIASPNKAVAPPGDVVPALPVDVDDESSAPMPTPPRSLDCPTCGYRPSNTHEVALHREELETVWLFADPDHPECLVERWHCSQCQPHQAEMGMCDVRSVTVMLGGDLVSEAEHHGEFD